MTTRRDFIRMTAIGAGVLAAGASSFNILKAVSSAEKVKSC